MEADPDPDGPERGLHFRNQGKSATHAGKCRILGAFVQAEAGEHAITEMGDDAASESGEHPVDQRAESLKDIVVAVQPEGFGQFR